MGRGLGLRVLEPPRTKVLVLDERPELAPMGAGTALGASGATGGRQLPRAGARGWEVRLRRVRSSRGDGFHFLAACQNAFLIQGGLVLFL